ncbi:fructose-specific PTS transporter subunit EIIC [Streptomyces qinglanensis]|uniref:PTS system, fructose-specific IIC component n=1 Tax=Streptomyces qinglanensis TaxID=943816 RepID=A0A1H9VH65_9ACTN|nr:fructose-specific PTS transporter subunit EIIC [Streptomyces qinglanensis]SES21150.1 PTS system, fructose-specific IIC component [Streptomyces qinglanensis]
MTSPADPRDGAAPPADPGLKLLAVTACPTGIAHTYMAAEKLTQAAQARGIAMKVETQGSIGAENVLSDNDVSAADGVIVAADKDVDLGRFGGKRVLCVGVAEGISDPDGLIDRVREAPVHPGGAASAAAGGARGGGSGGDGSGGGSGTAATGPAGAKGRERSAGYKALMNGVSYMIPFVVVGGLLIAVSLALGGHPQADGGLVIPDGSFWKHVNDIGVIGFTLMVPILSGYIAYAIGDRPALVPGMIGGWIANTGELYDSESGAGFIGAIVTGFLAGYLVRWIKRIPVSRFVRPIMPIIVIPIVATSALGLFFVYVIGRPISWVFENLTDFLGGMTGTSAALLGVVLGLMIAFDMGGPVNKTAFLFGAGLVSKSPEVMGMCAAAIPVPPLGQGLATLLRRRFYSDQERETGLAALFMGFFGITEGAIPFAAARPATVIPANMLGGAVAGGIAGLASVGDNVPHGGPIVAVLGAVDGVAMFFVALLTGAVVTAATTVGLVTLGARRSGQDAPGTDSAERAVRAPAAVGAGVLSGEDAGDAARSTAGDPAGDSATPAARAAEPPPASAAEQPAVPAQGGAPGSAAGSAPEEGPTAGEPEAAEGAPGTAGTGTESSPAPDAAAESSGVLSGYLSAETVREQLAADGKEAGIREMAELLGRSGKVSDSEALVRAALAREEQGTTGLGEEIAVPHAKTDAVTAPVVGFARSAEGIEWGSLDGTRARLVFMIAVPEAAAGDEHLRILALLSRKLMDPAFRTRLLEAPDKDTVLAALAEIG